MPQRVTKDEIVKFAEAVAGHLDGFTASAPDGWQGVDLTDSDGRHMWVRRWRKGSRRVEIRGFYGDLLLFQCSSSDRTPSISVSIDSNPVQAAADIKRRFLPDFVAYWDELEKRRMRFWDEQTGAQGRGE